MVASVVGEFVRQRNELAIMLDSLTSHDDTQEFT
jgi:hypothetical protein